jgi:hypothetical protein
MERVSQRLGFSRKSDSADAGGKRTKLGTRSGRGEGWFGWERRGGASETKTKRKERKSLLVRQSIVDLAKNFAHPFSCSATGLSILP